SVKRAVEGGGARPNFFSACRPRSVILSDDHGCRYDTSTVGFSIPCCSNTARISVFITSRAGQPVKVGVISTATAPVLIRKSVITPRSTRDSTGISGSLTSSSQAITADLVISISKDIQCRTNRRSPGLDDASCALHSLQQAIQLY